MTSSKFIDLKSQLKIVEVIGKFLTLNKKGKNYWAICPFHSDNSPSLSVSEDKNIFKCFTCEVSGDSIFFLMKHQKLQFPEALQQACDICGIKYEKSQKQIEHGKQVAKQQTLSKVNKHFSSNYHSNLLHKKNTQLLSYLTQQRHLTLETIKHFNIGYAEDNNVVEGMVARFNTIYPQETISLFDVEELGLLVRSDNDQLYDFYRNRVIFPISNIHGEITGFSGRSLDTDSKVKYLNSKESSLFKKAETFYNINNIKKNHPIYIFEGFFDLIKTHQAGITNSLALMGVNLSANLTSLLLQWKEDIIFCLDNDQAGLNNTFAFAKKTITKGLKIKIVDLLDTQCKDIDELLDKDLDRGLQLLKQPVDFFDWFKSYLISNLPNPPSADQHKQKHLTKDSKIDLRTIKKCVDLCLNWIVVNQGGSLQANTEISYEVAEYVVDGTFSLYQLLSEKDLESTKDSIVETKESVLQLFKNQLIAHIDCNAQQSSNTQSHTTKHSTHKTSNGQSSNIKNKINSFLSSLILYWYLSQERLNSIFPDCEWFLGWEPNEALDSEFKNCFAVLRKIINFNSPPTEASTLKLLKEFGASDKVDHLLTTRTDVIGVSHLNNFFITYFDLNILLLEESKKSITLSLSLSFAEKYEMKKKIQKEITNIKSVSHLVFKQITTFLKI